MASLLADLGHEVPTTLLPSLLTGSLGAPAAALGLIEGVSDGLAGAARLAGGALADDPRRRRRDSSHGYTATAVLTSLTGAATVVWQAVPVDLLPVFDAGGPSFIADNVHPSDAGHLAIAQALGGAVEIPS